MNLTSTNPFAILEQRLHNIEVMLLECKLGGSSTTVEPSYKTIEQAAHFLGRTPNALRVMVSKRQIPFIKKHGKLYFRTNDIIDWLESGSIDAEDNSPEENLAINKKRS